MTVNRADTIQLTRNALNGLQFLKPEEIDRIHVGALALLEKVGLKVELKEAVDLLHGNGAKVEKGDGFFKVKLPPSLVEDCIAQTPKELTYYGRNKENDLIYPTNNTAFAAFGQCVNVLDLVTGEARPSTKADIEISARIQDALPNLKTVARTMAPGDKPPNTQAIHCIDAIVRNTGKHISGGASDRRTLRMIIQMLEVAAGSAEAFKSRPFYSPSFCPTSPLTLGKSCCEVAIDAAAYGLNMVVMIMPLAGGTGPATIAGTVTLGIAEQLSGLVLTQLTRKASPITLGSATTIMDLKSGISAMGAPESGMINACLAQMAQFYQLPCRVACGVSDACMLDAQIGYEFSLNAFMAAMAGATIIFGGGALESGLTHSPAKLLMDHESMCHIHQILNGVSVDNEDLALEVTSEIGPGNSFLMHRHTFDRMKSQSRSVVFNRQPRESWMMQKSSNSVSVSATEQALGIIENHTPPALPDGADQVLTEMINTFEAQLVSTNG